MRKFLLGSPDVLISIGLPGTWVSLNLGELFTLVNPVSNEVQRIFFFQNIIELICKYTTCLYFLLLFW